MPMRKKGDTNGLIERTQAPSRSPFAPASIVGDQFAANVLAPGPPQQFSPQVWQLPDLPTPLSPVTEGGWATTGVAPTAFRPDERRGPAYQNGYAGQAIPFNPVIPGTPGAPYMNRVSNLAWPQPQQLNTVGMVQAGPYQIRNPQSMLQESLDAPTKKRSLLLELPHLLGYTVGMMAIFGLYLVIPMMILLNATLPGNWNKLLIALGILVVGELVICVILVKTMPARKSKHRHQSALPRSLPPDQRRSPSPDNHKGRPYISSGSGQVQGGMPLDLIAANSDEKRRLAAAIAARASERNGSGRRPYGSGRPQGSPLQRQAELSATRRK
jgi:hypothetical protein